ncbi:MULTISPECIES: TRAP transporter small permease [Halomonadaceae]|jgi:C4-dicarboxylate transporter, DctQ subunit|uniref:TRAP transporter small permease protein n=1 Tax=Vreelandella titanicae TaxID=664683 RepID=A0A654AWA3_9GAMM|nr:MULTISPECIES: TRAP transporter small permease [Halomonas]QKS27162.1 C4-dicarboxylate TRAP transporter small permease protein DctQ [Halomonas titanicae]TMU17784.1 TRAP transporter small permease [Halomonas sp. ATBC28]CAD5269256.1 Tripartite ATP-independent periplasmic transporter DctQ component [Halomonas sp. I3]CAD5275166.1 Tripartite ATP-independent periplasmic transporter DctQ component [Halomonas sp. 113]CAD5276734.1 Tripartite ATP-independent periplasmic transporter DctQ component [Halo
MRKLDRLISRAEEVLIGLLILSASFILFANVIARYVFNDGFSWAEELVRYQIVWMVLLGASVAARQGIHIGIDILRRFSPPLMAKWIELLVHAVSIAFCLFLVVYGFQLTEQTHRFGQVSSALQAPMWIVQLAIPVGALLMGIRFTQHFFRTLLGREQASAHLDQIG